jgi:hypothetical protein
MSILFDLERQRTNYGRLFAYLLRHPASISRLTRFSGEIARARTALTEAIVTLVTKI